MGSGRVRISCLVTRTVTCTSEIHSRIREGRNAPVADKPSARHFTLAVTLAVGVIAGSAASNAQQVQSIAAVVNDDIISSFDVQQRVNLVLSSSGIEP